MVIGMQRVQSSQSPEALAVSPSGSRASDATNAKIRPDRPCDACRRRKSRCVMNADSTSCVMCEFHHQACTFAEDPTPRKRKIVPPPEVPDRSKRLSSDTTPARRISESSGRAEPLVEDYADLQGPSLLKRTLGLQNHRHARYIGLTAEFEPALLDLRLYDDAKGESPSENGSIRKVGLEHFWQLPDQAEDKTRDIEALDKIEQMVSPHGRALIRLYFRIVHPSFPILHKKVYLEKYARTHREFSPPLLAAVYLLALNWWSYSSELAQCPKPDDAELEKLAFQTLQDVSSRAKLSTVQAGLLLMQRQHSGHAWTLTAQLVAIGQDLGLHLDCGSWQIPSWERGLRKRLAWALFMQDIWSALIFARPPHISRSNWAVQAVAGSDFPENAADEDEEDGSTEVEKGRTLFSAMISLSKMLSELMEALYSQTAEAQIQRAPDCTKAILERAKPVQIQLRTWYTELPDVLRMDNLKPGKLSSQGYLHLAYFATEITLHRRVIRSLSSETDPYLTQICRSAAKARLMSAMDFFNRLRNDHLQAFWFFPSKISFALIGTFSALLWVTAVSPEEAEFYQRRLQEYRWTLRVSRKSAEFLEIASGTLESTVGTLLKAVSSSPESRRLSYPAIGEAKTDEDIAIDNFLENGDPGVFDMSGMEAWNAGD